MITIHEAAEKGDDASIKACRDAGVIINETDTHGNTALHYASWEGHIHSIKLLISLGADVNIKRAPSMMGNSWTPLHMAVENDQLGAVETLINHGADVNAVDEYGQSPLFLAVSDRIKKDIAILLIQRGASKSTLIKDILNDLTGSS